MTIDTLWTSYDSDAIYADGTIVLTIESTSEAPEERYVWEGSTDLPYSTIAEEASKLCADERRRGQLWVIAGDGSGRIATIERTGGWRVGA